MCGAGASQKPCTVGAGDKRRGRHSGRHARHGERGRQGEPAASTDRPGSISYPPASERQLAAPCLPPAGEPRSPHRPSGRFDMQKITLRQAFSLWGPSIEFFQGESERLTEYASPFPQRSCTNSSTVDKLMAKPIRRSQAQIGANVRAPDLAETKEGSYISYRRNTQPPTAPTQVTQSYPELHERDSAL